MIPWRSKLARTRVAYSGSGALNAAIWYSFGQWANQYSTLPPGIAPREAASTRAARALQAERESRGNRAGFGVRYGEPARMLAAPAAPVLIATRLVLRSERER
jgi:hypothetical protein